MEICKEASNIILTDKCTLLVLEAFPRDFCGYNGSISRTLGK